MSDTSAQIGTALVCGKITGKVGDKFSAGRLGNYTITKAPDGGTEVLLGPPFSSTRATSKIGRKFTDRRCVRGPTHQIAGSRLVVRTPRRSDKGAHDEAKCVRDAAEAGERG